MLQSFRPFELQLRQNFEQIFEVKGLPRLYDVQHFVGVEHVVSVHGGGAVASNVKRWTVALWQNNFSVFYLDGLSTIWNGEDIRNRKKRERDKQTDRLRKRERIAGFVKRRTVALWQNDFSVFYIDSFSTIWNRENIRNRIKEKEGTDRQIKRESFELCKALNRCSLTKQLFGLLPRRLVDHLKWRRY